MAQRAEVIIYAISTNTSGMKTRGDKVLEHFADETGGKAFFPFKIQDVADAFSQIQDELRSQYGVSYKPADFEPNGKYRKIEILADNKKYKVRARKGYYAPRQYRITGNRQLAHGPHPRSFGKRSQQDRRGRGGGAACVCGQGAAG